MVCPAFELPAEDGVIRRSPFSFKITDAISKDSQAPQAIFREVKDRFLTFIRESKHSSRHYDEIIILPGTGVRVSEL